jgi:DNA mismatch repair protein MutS2
VISGPNTGGKTVALKTVGLLAAMAQCGLHVPAAQGTRLPVLRRLYADIGDEQSIAESLSTFSAHLSAIVTMTRDLESPALVLLDEVGAGTDPTEGGALAVAVVDWFRCQGALVIATTHHGQMKGWARSTEGVGCASFGYDPATWAPTYALIHGTPGRSLALEMAQRLGLPPVILESARALRDEAQARAEDLLRELEAERAEAAREAERLRQERRALEAERAEHEARRRVDEDERRALNQRFAQRLEERGERAASQAREAIDAAAKRVEETRAAAAATRRARVRTSAEVRQVFAEAAEEVVGTRPPNARPLQPGDSVRVRGLGVCGRLIALDGPRAEVELRGKRLRVAAAELEHGAEPAPATRPRSERPHKSDSEVPAEINVIGLTVAEALPRVDKLLDDAALAEKSRVRVIHGLGKGRLRAAVGDLLDGHPHVAAFSAAEPRDGGGGVTVVELRS